MKHLPRYQVWMLGISLGALIAILIAPQTSWTARSGITSLVVKSPDYDSEVYDSAEEQLLLSHPSDYQLAIAGLALAPWSPTDPGRLPSSAKIEHQFPTIPVVAAAVTRILCRNSLQVDTEVEEETLGNNQSSPDKPITPSDLQQIAALEYAARAGESLDPTNAYFPTMRAVAAFARRDYVSAEADLDQAGRDTGWDEYLQDETDGRLRLSELAHGPLSGADRTEIVSSVLLPQYASIRAAARMGRWRAVLAETSGRIADGIELRHALMHIGALMRVNSTFYIGTLVGIAITHISIYLPEGENILTVDLTGLSGAQRLAIETNRRREAYRSFLVKNGCAAEADWASRELMTGDSVYNSKAVVSKITQQYNDQSISESVLLFCNWLVLGWILVAAIFWCGSIMAQEAVSVRRDGKINVSSITKIFTGAAALIVFLLVLRRSMGFVQSVSSILSITSPLPGWVPISDNTQIPHVLNLVAYSLLIVPFLTFVIATTIVSWFRRQKARRTMTIVVMKSFVSVASVLLLLYCILVVFRSREDQTVQQQYAAKLAQGEGPYFSKLSGQYWPGFVPEPVQTI